MTPQRPGGPHFSTERAQLHERVKQQFGAYGTMPAEEEQEVDEGEARLTDREILEDDFRKPTIRIIAGVFLSSLFAYIGASPGFDAPGIWSNSFRFDTALVVVWGPLLYFAMARLKLTMSIRVYLVLALFIEPFSETMLRQAGDGYWDSVLWPAAVAFYGTIKEWSGLPGASLPVFFLVTVGLLYRSVWGKKDAGYIRPPKFARNLLLFFLVTVIGLCGFGYAHGGDIQSIVRQILHIAQLPLIALLFLYALRIPDDLAALGTIYVVTALARSLLVVYVYFGVCMPEGITDRPGLPEWCTTHSDSVLFVGAIVIVAVYAFEERTMRAIQNAILVSSVILVAMVLNNRRLAFVSLSIAPVIIYLALRPSRRKRGVTTALVVAVPLIIGYVLIGSDLNSASPLLKPARLVMSVLDQKDMSSISRDIENENLIYTLRQSPIVSTGFGFEYQYSPNNPPVDLSDVFVNYRLIAHNGVLWLWSLGGLIGFTALWLLFPVTGTLAMRGYRAAESPLERTAALASLGGVAICIVQIWGDQGINGYMTPVTFGVCFAIATRLATRVT
jgi:hypothetical protein